jgi:hypothetical protein
VRVIREPLRINCGLAICCAVALLVSPEDLCGAAPHDATKLDCGVHALYLLLRVEGHAVDLRRLESALPPRHPDGYSMAELAAGARSLGVTLEGIRFGKRNAPLSRPAIVFLTGPRGGHFAVLRPVGTTGTMVQVIDPPSAPWIADYDQLLSSKAWTGRILVPRDLWIVRNAARLMTSAAGLALLLAGFGITLRIARARASR